MTMADDLLGEGFRSVREEVITKRWPQVDPSLQLLVEVVFYAGCIWVMKVLNDEGMTPQTVARIDAELRAHTEKAKAMRKALDET